MKWKFKKNDLVLIDWIDITAALHTDEEILPTNAQTVGWVQASTKQWVRLVTTKYLDGSDLTDQIVIPKGVIRNVTKM